MEFMATESKAIQAPRSRIERASRGLFTHRVGGYFVVVTIVLLVAFAVHSLVAHQQTVAHNLEE